MTVDIWTRILKSVASSKDIPVSNIWAYSSDPVSSCFLVKLLQDESHGHDKESIHGVAFSYLNVRDEDNETIGRIGVYQLSSTFNSVVMSPTTVQNTLSLIILDWNHPWNFISELSNWLVRTKTSLETLFKDIPHALKELKTQRELAFQSYGCSSNISTDTPLEDGVLCSSLGLNCAIVCINSEQIAALQKKKLISEDQVDYINIILRILSLQYGLSVLYINSADKKTTSRLMTIISNQLLGIGKDVQQKPEIVEREQIFVPFGWDSLGKIKLMSENDPDLVKRLFNSDIHALSVDYEKRIPEPLHQKEMTNNNTMKESNAEEEQEFLRKEHGILATLKTQNTSQQTKPLPKPQISTSQKVSSVSTGTAKTDEQVSTQNEVLANFFQSLLNKKSASPAKPE